MISEFGKLTHQVISVRNYSHGNKIYRYIDKYYVKVKSIEMPEKFKGTFVEKWITYWRDVYRDYADVVKEAGKEMYKVPWKGVALISVSSLCTYFVKTNPDENSFRDRLISYSNELIFVGSSIRNPESVKHLKFLEQCYNEGIVRRQSFGLFSIIWVDNYNRYLGIYKALCPFLQPDYFKFHERIIDIGFCGRWWSIEKIMIDIDVNPEEWNDKYVAES